MRCSVAIELPPMCANGRTNLDGKLCPSCGSRVRIEGGKLAEHPRPDFSRCYMTDRWFVKPCNRRSVAERDGVHWCQRHDPVMREQRRYERAVKDRDTYVRWVTKGLTDEELEAAWRQRRADDLVGKKVRWSRLLQGRVVMGEITDKLVGGHQTQYICHFGPTEFLELCVRSVRVPGYLEVTASGALIEILDG